jgi:hypothetical protein
VYPVLCMSADIMISFRVKSNSVVCEARLADTEFFGGSKSGPADLGV